MKPLGDTLCAFSPRCGDTLVPPVPIYVGPNVENVSICRLGDPICSGGRDIPPLGEREELLEVVLRRLDLAEELVVVRRVEWEASDEELEEDPRQPTRI